MPAADVEEVNARREILRTEWEALVGELGHEGGPRVIRVDYLSARLRRVHIPLLGAELGMVELDAAGDPVIDPTGRVEIDRDRVVTLEEEANLANFISLEDHVHAVDGAWVNYRDRFLGQGELGSGLVGLSQALSVVVESVDEVYAILDDLQVGSAERIATILDLAPTRVEDMSVEDLLSWLRGFAAEEALALIQEGGARGVDVVEETASLLLGLVDQFIALVADPSTTLPSGLTHDRTERALRELRGYLAAVVERAGQI